jgi:hypothetical protein
MSRIIFLIFIVLLNTSALSATKPHIVSFGKWTTVKWFIGHDENQRLDLKVRPLYVDGHTKEYTIGPAHEITETLFVVRRAFRVNDTLAEDKPTQPRWQWERGGWLLVDKSSARIPQISLPEFDTYFSAASWYRDYVAYCGISDDGEKLYQMVAQLGRRRPVLKKIISKSFAGEMPDSACPEPTWQRQPARVTFQSDGDAKSTFEVRGHAVNLITTEEEQDEQGNE